jgi:hypothetical protein
MGEEPWNRLGRTKSILLSPGVDTSFDRTYQAITFSCLESACLLCTSLSFPSIQSDNVAHRIQAFPQVRSPVMREWRFFSAGFANHICFPVFNSMGQRRFQSTSTTFLTKGSTKTFQKAWLSDPSTYPLIAVMGIAGALVTGFIASGLIYSPE